MNGKPLKFTLSVEEESKVEEKSDWAIGSAFTHTKPLSYKYDKDSIEGLLYSAIPQSTPIALAENIYSELPIRASEAGIEFHFFPRRTMELLRDYKSDNHPLFHPADTIYHLLDTNLSTGVNLLENDSVVRRGASKSVGSSKAKRFAQKSTSRFIYSSGKLNEKIIEDLLSYAISDYREAIMTDISMSEKPVTLVLYIVPEALSIQGMSYTLSPKELYMIESNLSAASDKKCEFKLAGLKIVLLKDNSKTTINYKNIAASIYNALLYSTYICLKDIRVKTVSLSVGAKVPSEKL